MSYNLKWVHEDAPSKTEINFTRIHIWTSLMAQMVKNVPEMQKTRVQALGWEDPLEKAIATYSSVLVWGIPWIEETGGLQSTRLQRVGYD